MLDIEAAKKNPFQSGLFKDQVAIVTGGGTGIGLAVARELAQLGARVVIASRKPEHYDTARIELEQIAGPERVRALKCDIREVADVEALVSQVLEAFGRIDVLINNAGGQFPSPATRITPRGFDAVVRNNLNGTFYLTREVADRAMIQQRSGVIVNVIANIYRGFPGMAHTGAARAAVDNLTKSLSIEWAPFDIRINAVAPGIIRSSGLDQYPQELVHMCRIRTPQKRLGTVEEVAHAVVYLASPAALFVTGATLNIDGGSSLWGDTWPIPDRPE
jgi:citronellol/citronellal dehydrogenase